ncbi:MAG TPA: hypothetical protein VG965_06405 [Patescibacteria group bacterium]|nr:hypothetical protein [Patescibacteria group bacterium]
MGLKRKIIICVLIVACFIVFLLLRSSSQAAQIATDLLPLPKVEPVTELYFTDQNSLTKTVTSGSPIKFRFTVHNLEGKTTAYSYQVILVSGDVNTIIDTGKFSLIDSASKTITESTTLGSYSRGDHIIVSLPARNQQINFYLNGGEGK